MLTARFAAPVARPVAPAKRSGAGEPMAFPFSRQLLPVRASLTALVGRRSRRAAPRRAVRRRGRPWEAPGLQGVGPDAYVGGAPPGY